MTTPTTPTIRAQRIFSDTTIYQCCRRVWPAAAIQAHLQEVHQLKEARQRNRVLLRALVGLKQRVRPQKGG